MAGNEPVSHLLICDAGPLIHLDELECLQLLADFRRILVPEAVWLEVQRHRPSALHNRHLNLERIVVPADHHPQLDALCQVLTLHSGEREALRLALKAPNDCILLTDDTAARLAAESLRLEAHGTLGVLLRAVRRGQLSRDEVVERLRNLPTVSTLHIRTSFLQSVIEQLESLPADP